MKFKDCIPDYLNLKNLDPNIKKLLRLFKDYKLDSKYYLQINFDYEKNFEYGEIYLFDEITGKGKYVISSRNGYRVYSYLSTLDLSYDQSKLFHSTDADGCIGYLCKVINEEL
jgi:hypothetical protein